MSGSVKRVEQRTPWREFICNGRVGVENTDGRQILMRSLAAFHIHAMKIHRLLCNDRRRQPTGWIKRHAGLPINADRPIVSDFNPSFRITEFSRVVFIISNVCLLLLSPFVSTFFLHGEI